MHHFQYRSGRLHCEAVALDTIADAVGTPCYVYSTATLTRHARVIAEAFEGLDALIAYSVKANGNLGVLATLAEAGCGADVVSAGEMQRALAAGIPAGRSVFSGVGKTRDEMQVALDAGIHQFNVESGAELAALSDVADGMGLKARWRCASIRTWPPAGTPTSPLARPATSSACPGPRRRGCMSMPSPWRASTWWASTCTSARRSGISRPCARPFARRWTSPRACGRRAMRSAGWTSGGGLGIPYAASDDPAPPSDYAAMIREVAGGHDLQLILEPGRVVAGNAGVLVTEALYLKPAPDRTFLIVDAGMNDLMRPALYDAHHDMLPLAEPADGRGAGGL